MEAFDHYARARQEKPRLGLRRMEALMAELGHPERSLSCLHIAGTNGKGSVAVFLDSILREAGYHVGRYTTPELCDARERITENGKEIDEAELASLLAEMEAPTARVAEKLGDIPSPFEIFTAAAFLYFARRGCAYVVLETGMGGALDATNVIEAPLVSVLTRISMDHMAYLGETLGEIARQKAGIIKPACRTGSVFSAPQSAEAAAVLEEAAEKAGNALTFVAPPPPKRHYGMHEAFFFPGYGDIRCGLAGVHQIENAYLALAVARRLGIDIFAAQCGVTFARHPARMEILRQDPLLLFDGAHNSSGIDALCTSLTRYGIGGPCVCVYATMADKDYRACLSRLAEMPETQFLFTEVADNPRALPAAELMRAAQEMGLKGEAIPTLREALRVASGRGLPTVICGSLYLYADLLKER